jgi:redox-sensitive bicupin YhaK (pirin superfamily)
MVRLRRSAERGHANHGWLDTYHTFSFDTYYDPANMGFRSLRVINEDRVGGGGGFPTHPHRDMEIVTYVLEGALEHRDSMGNHGVIRPGEVQRMSAGTGVRHSEFNASASEPVHLLQIWLLPERQGIHPSYEQKTIGFKQGALQQIAGPHNGEKPGSQPGVLIHQDAKILAARLGERDSVAYALAPGRHAWLQVTRGSVKIGEQTLAAGDGAAMSDETDLAISGTTNNSEILLFDLA